MRAARPEMLTVGLALAMATPAGAQVAPGNVDSGRDLVSAWCRDCHQIGVSGVPTGNVGPVFRDVANLPSTTALSLRAFLQSSHDNAPNLMPNVQFTRAQAEDIVAYILSLKGK